MMKSPFPGMDPYLESCWGDVHTSLMTYARDQLRPQMPGDLKVRVEERVSVHDPDEEDEQVAEIDRIASYLPDLSITERPPSGFPATGKSSTLAVAEPFFIPRITELRTERTLQIVDPRSGNRIITTIEILSPTNKNDSKGRIAYRKKQQQLADSDINLVEIDLLRGGSYVLIPPWDSVPRSCRGTYRVAVSRATDPENFEMYRVLLRQRLPAIKIPLRPNDPDARLDLQLLIDAAYENGGYGSDIDYNQQPIPPFNTEDATWAAAVIREASPR